MSFVTDLSMHRCRHGVFFVTYYFIGISQKEGSDYVHRSVKITAKLRSPIGDFSHLDFDHRSVIVDPRLKSPICNHSTGVARIAICYSNGISL